MIPGVTDLFQIQQVSEDAIWRATGALFHNGLAEPTSVVRVVRRNILQIIRCRGPTELQVEYATMLSLRLKQNGIIKNDLFNDESAR